MYAIVKTGGKQYKVAPETRSTSRSSTSSLATRWNLRPSAWWTATRWSRPQKAAKTKVVATVLEQFKGRQGAGLQVQEAQELQRSCAVIVRT